MFMNDISIFFSQSNKHFGLQLVNQGEPFLRGNCKKIILPEFKKSRKFTSRFTIKRMNNTLIYGKISCWLKTFILQLFSLANKLHNSLIYCFRLLVGISWLGNIAAETMESLDHAQDTLSMESESFGQKVSGPRPVTS